MHALEWLTAGLAFFALAQVVVQVRSERQRQRERCEDKTRADDEAMQLAWAEYFRIDRLAVEWEKADIVSMAALGVLRASDVLPRDWTTMMGALAHLSIESGYLGGVALTLGHDTERLVATLNSLVEAERAKDNAAFRLRNEYGNASMTYVAKSLRSSQPDAVKELEKHIKGNVRDLANLLWDAVRQSPRTDIIRQLDFHDDMISSFGKGARTLAGTKRGLAASAKARSERAARFAGDVLPDFKAVQQAGAKSLTAMAGALNGRKVPAPRGGRWSAIQVRRLLARLD